MKECKRCGETKPLSEFYSLDGKCKDKYRTWCKECFADYQKIRRAGDTTMLAKRIVDLRRAYLEKQNEGKDEPTAENRIAQKNDSAQKEE